MIKAAQISRNGDFSVITLEDVFKNPFIDLSKEELKKLYIEYKEMQRTGCMIRDSKLLKMYQEFNDIFKNPHCSTISFFIQCLLEAIAQQWFFDI